MGDQDYVSSIINKYGDTSKVKEDVKVLNEIISRQGTTLLIDVISEYAGKAANKFNLNANDRADLINNIKEELAGSLSERV